MQLNELKGLTIDQYETARSRALDRVQKRIGDRPERKRFERELGSLTTALDWIALVVFVAALAISSAHIIQYMGAQARESYSIAPGAPGVFISADVYSVVHQVGAILLAEAAAILFATMHSMGAPSRAGRRWWLRWLSIPLLLAIVAGVFVFAANVSSGVNLLVSVMPPLFTLGIAVRLESLIVAALQRRDDVTQRYLAALKVYEQANTDPTKHPDYEPILKQEVWAALMKLTSNREYRDAPAPVKHAAVRREMERDLWAFRDDVQPVELANTSSVQERDQQRPFGNTVPMLDDSEFTLMTPPANALGIGGSGSNHHFETR